MVIAFRTTELNDERLLSGSKPFFRSGRLILLALELAASYEHLKNSRDNNYHSNLNDRVCANSGFMQRSDDIGLILRGWLCNQLCCISK